MARFLDGTADYLTIPDHNSLDVGDVFTYALWFKRNRSGINYETLFAKGQYSAVCVFGAGTGNNTLEVYGSYLGVIAKSTNSIADTAWHQTTITKNGSTSFKIYIDSIDV